MNRESDFDALLRWHSSCFGWMRIFGILMATWRCVDALTMAIESAAIGCAPMEKGDGICGGALMRMMAIGNGANDCGICRTTFSADVVKTWCGATEIGSAAYL